AVGSGKCVLAQSEVSFSLSTTTALRSRDSQNLTEARGYGYLGMKSHLWESKGHKYRLDLSFSLRGYYDGVHDLTNRYSGAVRKNEGRELDIRHCVVSVTAPNWTFHVGRQQVVWGEAVGVFVADVVNPKDYRKFLVLDFSDTRIPLWGVDAQRSFGSAGKVELFVSPDIRRSKLPVPGSEFEFYRPTTNIPVVWSRPGARTVGNTSVGVRYSR